MMLFRLIFTWLKHLALLEIQNNASTEFDALLQQVHLGELDVLDLFINEQQDMPEGLLGVVSTPANDTLSTCTSEMVSGTVFMNRLMPSSGRGDHLN